MAQKQLAPEPPDSKGYSPNSTCISSLQPATPIPPPPLHHFGADPHTPELRQPLHLPRSTRLMHKHPHPHIRPPAAISDPTRKTASFFSIPTIITGCQPPFNYFFFIISEQILQSSLCPT